MRLQVFEWEDQPWFPRALRTAMTSYLATTYGITPLPKVWAACLAKVLKRDGPNEIVDLGSGSGGPVSLVARELVAQGFDLRITLTDLYPGDAGASANEGIRYWTKPVDATRVPGDLRGIRTMFASFHHFRPEEARGILRDAFEQKSPICVFEGTARTFAAIAGTVVIPLLVLVLMLRVRPLTWVHMVFTYLVPILPLVIFWDGLISQLRTYSVDELKELVREMQDPGYQWEIGTIPVPATPMAVPYLVGSPVR